jgi:CubicO group peptidase (beta-lactamase class C family)
MLSRRRLLQAGAGAVPAIALGTAPAWADSAEPSTTGVVPTSLAGFDKALKTYIKERDISCAQLAVAKNGKILLARGYGSYTRPDGSTAKVQPTSLFRIASLSKSLTAAAIARLAQDGELSLGDKIADLLDLPTEADPRLANVTLWRLLQHTGGWDRGVTADPLWNDTTIAASLDVPLPIDHADIMKYTTAKKLKLLAPVEIERMRLGRSLRSEAFSTEVPYQSKYTRKSVVDASGDTVPYPYGGFNMPNQDANGAQPAAATARRHRPA